MKNIIFFFFVFILISCEKDELAIDKVDRGGLISTEINLQSNPNYAQYNYHNQVFFNLDDNTIVKESLKKNWDIGFENNNIGWRIILNSSKFGDVVEIENQNFETEITANDISSLAKRWDRPEGINYEYGTAIGDYRGKNSVYVINRGFKLNGNPYTEKKKLIISEVNDQYYSIKYSNLNNTNVVEKIIYKDYNTNFKYLSFENDSLINIEPQNTKWDILFTQYTHLFENPDPIPSYLVTGVLTNYLNNVTVAKDTSYEFSEILYDDINLFQFSEKQNEIGYNWKVFDLNSFSYSINPEINYIIKNQDNKYFKLRFIDYYNISGEIGYPTFEFQEL